MLSRKLLAAFFTTVICYFIVPFFFDDFSNSYFLIGLGVSIIAVPILFTVGIFSSIAIESLSKNEHILFSYIKHLVCGIIFTLIFLLLTGEISSFLSYIEITIIYVTFFFIIDYIIKQKNKKKNTF
ncbi:hypothetical protein [Ureibacillus sp. FSL E2-3493]|uniref:hypothetical protein n=1 Tax=Ureibacillus sp. FSL E2-3493 TaxID=2921367 RepID=UPI0031197B31